MGIKKKMASQEIAFCRNVLSFFFFFPLMPAPVWETQNKGAPRSCLMSLWCWMQLLFLLGKSTSNKGEGGERMQKMVLNEEAWPCRISLGKLWLSCRLNVRRKCRVRLQGNQCVHQKLSSSARGQVKPPGAREESQHNTFCPNTPASKSGAWRRAGGVYRYGYACRNMQGQCRISA